MKTMIIQYKDQSFALVRGTQEFIDRYAKKQAVKEIREASDTELREYKDWINFERK